MKVIGVVPARMGSGRFPGKPLHPIAGRPMVEHCYERAKLYDGWDGLFLATCDDEILTFGQSKGWPSLMTSDHHTRALDRVAEAAGSCGIDLAPDDVVVCVQADEPLLGPDVLDAVVKPFREEPDLPGTMLAMPILDEELWRNPDIVKIVHDRSDYVLYTSRAPIPYAKQFSAELGAKRVGGIFGFRWHFLQWFTETPESPLEIKEACDSNRICDNGFRQKIAEVPYRPYFSVDSPGDVALVEAALADDPLAGKY
ncbi:MAG: 3-deoxy-manno-octulosonate cytidylyltransferase [Magnetovibrionaceae bacterium]